MMSRKAEIDKMREAMGTLPHQRIEEETEFYVGVEGITVEMVEYPENPYRTIFEASVATWGRREIRHQMG